MEMRSLLLLLGGAVVGLVLIMYLMGRHHAVVPVAAVAPISPTVVVAPAPRSALLAPPAVAVSPSRFNALEPSAGRLPNTLPPQPPKRPRTLADLGWSGTWSPGKDLCPLAWWRIRAHAVDAERTHCTLCQLHPHTRTNVTAEMCCTQQNSLDQWPDTWPEEWDMWQPSPGVLMVRREGGDATRLTRCPTK